MNLNQPIIFKSSIQICISRISW